MRSVVLSLSANNRENRASASLEAVRALLRSRAPRSGSHLTKARRNARVFPRIFQRPPFTPEPPSLFRSLSVAHTVTQPRPKCNFPRTRNETFARNKGTERSRGRTVIKSTGVAGCLSPLFRLHELRSSFFPGARITSLDLLLRMKRISRVYCAMERRALFGSIVNGTQTRQPLIAGVVKYICLFIGRLTFAGETGFRDSFRESKTIVWPLNKFWCQRSSRNFVAVREFVFWRMEITLFESNVRDVILIM